MHCFRTGVEKGMKLCTAVQEGCGYKDTLCAHHCFAPLAKYFSVCFTYQPAYVYCMKIEKRNTWMWEGMKFLVYIVLVHELLKEMSNNVNS
jgi:hypothetical protein